MIQAAASSKSFAQRYVNVGAQQVAMIYARALLGAAQEAGQTEQVLAELDSFVTDVLDRFPKLEAVLSSALVSPDQKSRLLDRVFGRLASKPLLNSLKVIARHGRLNILRDVHRAAHELFDQIRGVVRVQVASAAELNEELKRRLTESVRQMFGGSPVLEVETRAELIGGLMMRVGDTVYDGSISTHLEKIRQQMIDRSVHEIQSRRDRFSSPEGN
jgi:F-type H+-transporting ATPase subunit delta